MNLRNFSFATFQQENLFWRGCVGYVKKRDQPFATGLVYRNPKTFIKDLQIPVAVIIQHSPIALVCRKISNLYITTPLQTSHSNG